MKRSTQPRNSSLERVVHPDEIQRAHQCLPEIHIAQVRFARELEPDISPSSGKHGWQPLDAHRGVDCMLENSTVYRMFGFEPSRNREVE